VLVLLGHTAPENVTGEIRTFAPSHVLFVDAAEFGAAPGSVRIFESADIGGMTSSTHTLPLAVIADYLTGELGCRVLFLGLQPKGVEFGERLSEEVAAAVADTVAILAQALRESPSAHSGPGGIAWDGAASSEIQALTARRRLPYHSAPGSLAQW
jgi:hydrogenase 3 maturation protease